MNQKSLDKIGMTPEIDKLLVKGYKLKEKYMKSLDKKKPKELEWENTFIFKYGYCSTDREKKIRENILDYIKELLTQQMTELKWNILKKN